MYMYIYVHVHVQPFFKYMYTRCPLTCKCTLYTCIFTALVSYGMQVHMYIRIVHVCFRSELILNTHMYVYCMCTCVQAHYSVRYKTNLHKDRSYMYTYLGTIINPRRACTARVTVVVLCVCVCLSACYHSSSGIVHFYMYVTTSVPTASIRLVFSSWILRRMLCSEVMASFAYRKSHQRYYRDPELISSTAQGYKVVRKPNRALNA